LRRASFVGELSGSRPVLQAYTVAALIYVAINFMLSRIARRLEIRQRRRYGPATVAVRGAAEDLTLVDLASEK
jgi:glutamate transport system permease protein